MAAAKLTRLTPEQERLMAGVANEWLGLVFDCQAPPDPEEVRDNVSWLYEFCDLKRPIVVVLDSPMACQMAAWMLRSQVESQVWSQVRSQVWSQVWSRVGSRVGSQVWGQVRSQDQYTESGTETVLWDAGWCSWGDYFRRIGIVRHAGFDRYVDFLRRGMAFYAIYLDGLAIVCGPPRHIRRDAEHRLHCEDGPAVLWRDGYGQYFWHGVSVPDDLIERPESITRERLAGEGNAEVRRAMRERLGNERFAELLDLVEVDRDEVGTGQYRQVYALHRTREPDLVAEEHIQFVQVRCHSTGREYMLCVPPDIRDVYTAVAWTFGEGRAEYAPIVEA